ncbi:MULTISPECIES: hypothetical protein [unclassified Campylobacter]|uniref:hypothetical protein n=1 Tax=unclassified Campylobacter TaxID=2593542 RepID=UPI0012380C3D|nr:MULTISPECIES: hypothetical protein [unclassified Campylobacter]KAA6227280.1 hypothetical protein FMM57_04905 [Campylobacter sp. LR286c]KAA6227847.1 hypothetical protein FMM54_01575 [Campylobacter sp. LR185c]KAA6228255.1 hypothetical protein FMM55_01380 [Campylobacter sp. LR196d]KAA6229255.1 hypothetical protein FMM58_07810 [Campylobacter sp. LR291e]KAA6231061.1 hypothetical protein FMM56_05075 [Campylobacter sp. LR264d]
MKAKKKKELADKIKEAIEEQLKERAIEQENEKWSFEERLGEIKEAICIRLDELHNLNILETMERLNKTKLSFFSEKDIKTRKDIIKDIKNLLEILVEIDLKVELLDNLIKKDKVPTDIAPAINANTI